MRPFRKAFGILSHLDESRRRLGRRQEDSSASVNNCSINKIRGGSERPDVLSDIVEASGMGGNNENLALKSCANTMEEVAAAVALLLTSGRQTEELDLKTFRIMVPGPEVGGGVATSKVSEGLNLDGALIATTTTSCNSPYSLKSLYNRSRRDFEARPGSANKTPLTTSLDFQSDENSKSLSNAYNLVEAESCEPRDEEMDLLESLFEETLSSYLDNLPYVAYSKFLEVSGLLFELIERRLGTGKSVILEISLELNSSQAGQDDAAPNSGQNCSSNAQSTSSFHSTLRSLKLSSGKGNAGNIIPPSTSDQHLCSSKGKLLLDVVHLNRNGVPVKSSGGCSSSSSGSGHQSGTGGSSRKWRYHIGSSCSNGGGSSVGGSNSCKPSASDVPSSQSGLGHSRRGKLFLESFPLLPKESAENTDSGRNREGIFLESPQASRLVRLEDFPCIIFSQNCLAVSNSKFSSVKDRSLALEFLKFPTEVRCLGLEQEARLGGFIARLVTNMHMHRLRFTLHKCSSSYTDLVSALKSKRRYGGRKRSEEQLQQGPEERLPSSQAGIQSSEWNSLGDSNLGMWWTMGTESEFLILCDYILNTNPINVVSIVNECDLHLKWAPFVTSSECLAYVGLYNQLVRNYSNMPWPIGLCQCSLYCVAIDVNRQEDSDSEPCIIITAVSLPEKADSVCGIKVKEAQSNASKLDVLSLCFVIQSVPNNPSQTRISFLSKSNMPIPSFVPKAVPSFIAKQIGKAFFNNIINIIERFSSSPFYQRIKSDSEFYEFVKGRLNLLDGSNFDSIQDPSPIRKKDQKEIKQREELNESLSKKDTRGHCADCGANGHSRAAAISSLGGSGNSRPDNSGGSSRRYSAAMTMTRMFPSF